MNFPFKLRTKDHVKDLIVDQPRPFRLRELPGLGIYVVVAFCLVNPDAQPAGTRFFNGSLSSQVRTEIDAIRPQERLSVMRLGQGETETRSVINCFASAFTPNLRGEQIHLSVGRILDKGPRHDVMFFSRRNADDFCL